LLLFYREPLKKIDQSPLSEIIKKVFENIVKVLADFKFVLFLIIVAGFWTMYFQLFFTLPVFIEQWVDTSGWYRYFAQNIPFIAETFSVGDQMDPEFITNFDAMFIILFQVLISSIIMRWKALNVMVSGFLISTIGMSLTVLTQNPLYIVAALFVFAIGEMTASPKITEYIGRIAPADKKALYMGYSFIPMFLGNLFTGIISGEVYQMMSDKVEIVREEAAKLDLSFPESLTQTEEFNLLAEKMGYSSLELTNYLWTNYEPYNFWMVIAAIGGGAALSLLLYNTYLMRE
jgi:POT family proton-dependent oligopeptide transporter